jgi:membrane-bound lytic murein transglycosylase B
MKYKYIMYNIQKQFIFILCIFFFTVMGFNVALAEDFEVVCQQITESNTGCPGISSSECKVLLQKCSDYYDEQAEKISEDITKTSQQKDTLSNQIYLFKKKIQNLDYQISQSNIKVKGLSGQIEDTRSSINETSLDIQDSQNKLTNILRIIYEEDKKPAIEILLEGSLSDFFSNLVYLESLNSKISEIIESTRNLRGYLQDQELKMDGEVSQLQRTIALQALQKEENQQNQYQQQQYLNLTEAQYQEQLKDKKEIESKSAKIKSMLFSLAGTDDTKAPSFGEAIEIAKSVGAITGVRPAFLLAIISQESAIGRNVGQCVLTDAEGNGKKISTGAPLAYARAMHPTRDIPPFLEITKKVGRDPYNTPVSCWIYDVRGGNPYGWGGAMGPAQFIPSTWNLFTNDLTKLLGKAPDPWAIKDSFTASAMYLADLGAKAQTESAESKAAGKYYGVSGSYNSMVMRRANCIQTFIDSGTMSSYCEGLIF